jgi:hypothetical protein
MIIIVINKHLVNISLEMTLIFKITLVHVCLRNSKLTSYIATHQSICMHMAYFAGISLETFDPFSYFIVS